MIKVTSLSFVYNGNTPYQTRALDGVSFTIKSGEMVGIIGPSGSGKSCLLRCLARLLTPTGGQISIDSGVPEKKQMFGLIIQEPEVQFFNETVYQEVAMALENQGLTREEIEHMVNQALQQVGFTGDLRQSPFHLSGGEQRRVALASILVLNPEVLLLDEPTVGLDARGLAMIVDLINDFRKRSKTVIIASHNLDFLYQQVDRYLVLNEGKLVADFKKSCFDRNIDLIKDLGLAVPEMIELQQRELPADIRAALSGRRDF